MWARRSLDFLHTWSLNEQRLSLVFFSMTLLSGMAASFPLSLGPTWLFELEAERGPVETRIVLYPSVGGRVSIQGRCSRKNQHITWYSDSTLLLKAGVQWSILAVLFHPAAEKKPWSRVKRATSSPGMWLSTQGPDWGGSMAIPAPIQSSLQGPWYWPWISSAGLVIP